MANYKKTEDAKEHIKKTAREMFEEKGYAHVKADEIAKQAGIAKGLIFYHFKSKEGLLSEIIQDEAKAMFIGLSDFVKNIPPDYALFQLFNGMFTTRESVVLADGFFEGELPEKYHYAVDKARLETVFPIIRGLILRGYEQGYFKMEEPEISYEIVSMGFNSFMTTRYHLFEDIEYHKRFLTSAAYVLNSTLNPIRFKFEFKIENERNN